MSFIIRNFKAGTYAQRNPALGVWSLSACDRIHATRFTSVRDAADTIPTILADCGEAWGVTANDIGVIPVFVDTQAAAQRTA